MVKFNFKKSIGGKLLVKLDRSIKESFVVLNVGSPNVADSGLPVEFQDECRGQRTLKRLDELCGKRDGTQPSPHKEVKAIKAQNVRDYANQIADNERKGVELPIESYHVTSNNNLEAFANALIQPTGE